MGARTLSAAGSLDAVDAAIVQSPHQPHEPFKPTSVHHAREHAELDLSGSSDGYSDSGQTPVPSSASRPPPESAPPGSTQFLRQRSTYDSSTSEDEDEEEHSNNHNFRPNDNRFSSPALARRRYPSTTTPATATATSLSMTPGSQLHSQSHASPLAARRLSSRSRRPSSSAAAAITSTTASVPSNFDVKGKGRAYDDGLGESHDSDADDNEAEHDGYALMRHDSERLLQGPRTAPLAPTRRSVSHSHPSRRYTTAVGSDPFTFPSHTTQIGGYPDPSTAMSKVKKKRSYTYAGPSMNGNGNGTGSGRSRQASGSSSPDMTRSHTPSSSNLESFNKRKAHLPRSASDFVSPNTSRPFNNARRPNSGSSSPMYPRSHSSANISSSDPLHQTQSFTSAPRNASAPAEQIPSNYVIRHKLSGLQMRDRKAATAAAAQTPPARSSPVRATFSSGTPQRENSTSSGYPLPARKRAKSALYPLDGSYRSPSTELHGNGTTVPARSFSTQHFKRHTALEPLSKGEHLSHAPQDHEDGSYQGKRVHLSNENTTVSPTTHIKHPTPSSAVPSVGRSILKSGSQPVSIASMVYEESHAGLSGSAVPIDTGPSLQELLGQVDLKNALALVREASSNTMTLDRKLPLNNTSPDFSFRSPSSVRASVDAPTYRSNSPVKSGDHSMLSSRTSAASPATNGSMARKPLLQHQGQGVLQEKMQAHITGAPVRPSTSIHFVPEPAAPEKKRKRLSMKRFLGGGAGSNTSSAGHSRQSSHDTHLTSEDRFSSIGNTTASSTIGHLSSLESDVFDPADLFEEIRARVDSAMRKYTASVKSELEIRYLPVYTALAMSQPPPNPLSVARHLQSEEENRISQSMHGFSPQSPSRRYIEEARSVSNRSFGLGQTGQAPPLADRIRKKGHKRSVWEVYPRDIAAYVMYSNANLDRYDPSYDANSQYRSDGIDTSSRGSRNGVLGHRHASSDISLGSLASIREGKPLDAFRSSGRSRHAYANSMSTSMRSTAGAARYMTPLSPARSRSGQSDISSLVASDDAVAANSRYPHLDRSDNGQGWTSEGAGHVQSSPEYSKWHHAHLPHHGHASAHKPSSSLSWSSRGFKILRPESNNSSTLGHSHKASQSSLSRARQFGFRGGTESEGALSDGHTSPVAPGHSSLHRSTASDVDLQGKNSFLNASARGPGLGHRPTISRSTSKTSSLTGLSKILGAGKRSLRNKEDDYRSTDNEDLPRGALSDSKSNLFKSTLASHSQNMSRQSLSGREADLQEEEDLETDVETFGRHILKVEEIDIDDNEMERAEGFLRDLKASLSKTEALERRVPPKMQTYLQKYIDYDTQRMQKGQLASVSLGGPPLLCRHFLPPGSVPTPQSGQSGASTPGGGQPTNGLDENLQKLRIDKSSLHLDKPSCIRRHSDSSLEDEEKRTPLLVKVTEEVDDASETLKYAIDRSRNIAAEQDAAKDRINEVVDMANSVESLVGGETFQQLRMLEDHLMRLRYSATDPHGYADAAWAVLSYILRIFFWFSWIGVTILRLVKATILLPFTVVVTILRWVFL